MTVLVITPGTDDVVGELVLGDGHREVDLMGNPPNGLYLVELEVPLPNFENTYAKGTDAEGQFRTRSLPQNGQASVKLRIDATQYEQEVFLGLVNDVEDIVASAHQRKGYLRYTWPNGRSVTYDLESCVLTGMPQTQGTNTVMIQVLEPEITFECRPYGLLDSVTVFTDLALNDTINSVELNNIHGHAPAFATLTLEEMSSEAADFIEYAVQQEGYVAGAPHRIDEDDMVITGFAGTQPGGAGTVIQCDLSDIPIACCGTGDLVHGGKQRVSIKTFGNVTSCWMRLAWSVDGGDFSYGPWVACPEAINAYVTQLAIVDLRDLQTTWTAQLEAYSLEDDQNLRVREFQIVPAGEVHGAARYPPRRRAGTSYQVLENFGAMSNGNLNGQTSAVGGLWNANTDIDVVDPGTGAGLFGGKYVEVSMTDGNDKRGFLADDIGPLDAQVAVAWDHVPGVNNESMKVGLLARYIDANNYATLFFDHPLITSTIPFQRWHAVRFQIVIDGDVTVDHLSVNSAWTSTFRSYPIRLVIDPDGTWHMYQGDKHLFSDWAVELAPGGDLDTGKIGLIASGDGVVPYIVGWDNLRVVGIPEDHALWPNRKLVITHDSARRQSLTDDDLYGLVQVDGDYLTIPASTEADLPAELVIKRRRFDEYAGLPDDGTGADLRGTLEITPRVTLL